MSLDNYLGQMDYQTREFCTYPFENKDIEKPVLEKKKISVDLICYKANPHECEKELCAEVKLYWDWVKREWFAEVSGDLIQDYGEGVIRKWPFLKGPCSLNESACRKLLEAYNIHESKLKLGLVAKTSPKKLARLNGK